MSAEEEGYDRRYFLESCGGSEFFRAYGADVLKPPLEFAYRKAGARPGMRALDLGCGRGELLARLRRDGVLAVGADFSREGLSLARSVSGAAVLLCDAKRLPFRAALFDRVFLIGVVDHLRRPELEAAFSEIGRVLAPGGKVLIHTCVNTQYYKRWTYGARLRVARALSRAGLPIREPSPPRSEEDEKLHVNEHSCGDLERFFRGIGWSAAVSAQPNYRMLLDELYGKKRPEGFPMKPVPAWRKALFRAAFRYPMDRVLAREIFVEASPAAPGM